MEEVWEQVDHLEAQQFTPRSFFKLHDVNDDGFIDETELEAIMMKEVRSNEYSIFLFPIRTEQNRKRNHSFSFRLKKFTMKRPKAIQLKNKKKLIE